jgi:hypothetical protein
MKAIVGMVVMGVAAVAVGAGPDVSKLPPASGKKGVTFAKDILPMFQQASCLKCHGDQRPKGELTLKTLDGVLKGGKDGQVVIPGKSAESALVIAVAQLDEETAMPPKRKGRGGPGGRGGPDGNGGGQPGRGPGGPGVRGGPRGPGGGPPARPLTPQQVGLIRAWIDQGAR